MLNKEFNNNSLMKNDDFVKLYNSGNSTSFIAKKYGCSSGKVYRYLKKQNVKIRTKSEALKLARDNGRLFTYSHTIPEASKRLTSEKSYILGVLCGDGWLSFNANRGHFQIGLCTIDKEFADKFFSCLYNVYKIKPTKAKRQKRFITWSDQYEVILYSKAVFQNLMKYGTSFRTKEWLVPKLICKSSLRLQSSFLQGFFDSEGDVDKNSRRIGGTSSNLEGLKNIESLLHNFGIRTSITKQSKKFIYTLRIQDRKSVEIFNKYIGFTIKRKQKILKQLVGSYSLWKSIPEEVKKLKSEMIILRRQGLSYNEISNKLNLSAATVWNHLNKYQDKYLFPRDPERLLP